MKTEDFWQLLAGLALFMYGMSHLEDALKQLEGRSFKLLLRKYTTNKLKAIVSGISVTAFLQSSSIVNLLLLSFVGAGIISMRNGLAVAFGANVGGTVNSWLVALFGFKLELISYTYPVIGLAGIGMILFRERKKIFLFCQFFTGLGLLFLGLEFVKSGMEASVNSFDFVPYIGSPLIIFVVIGFVITALIQTSAATVVLVLGALHAGAIPIETGIAVILGAELGTTVKIVIGAIGGNSAKKRLAAGNSIFNLVTSLLGYIFLFPIAAFLEKNVSLQDPLLIVVSFQSFINLGGVVIFYFILNPFARFLEERFPDKYRNSVLFITSATPELNEAALELFEEEAAYFVQRAIRLNVDLFELELHREWRKFPAERSTTRLNLDERYHLLKQAEGEILSIYSKMISRKIDENTAGNLQRLLSAIRQALYSAKSLRDIDHNRRELKNSESDVKHHFYHVLRKDMTSFYLKINSIFAGGFSIAPVEAELLNECSGRHQERVKLAIEMAMNRGLHEQDISTLLNVSREFLSSEQSMVNALLELNGKEENKGDMKSTVAAV